MYLTVIIDFFSSSAPISTNTRFPVWSIYHPSRPEAHHVPAGNSGKARKQDLPKKPWWAIIGASSVPPSLGSLTGGPCSSWDPARAQKTGTIPSGRISKVMSHWAPFLQMVMEARRPPQPATAYFSFHFKKARVNFKLFWYSTRVWAASNSRESLEHSVLPPAQ